MSLVLLASERQSTGADAYANALDNRFSSGPAVEEHITPEVAALEAGLKEQVQQMSHPPEPAAPPPLPVEARSPWPLAIGFTVGALMLGLAGVFALRRWNKWLEAEAAKRKQAETILTEDVWIAELREALEATPETASPVPDAPQVLFKEKLASARAVLAAINRDLDEADSSKLLQEVITHIACVKKDAELPHHRPIQLLAIALEGLLTQLSTKPTDVTASALRTAAGAVDLLQQLCGHALRADLLCSPAVRLLVVDDEPVSRRAVTFALRKVFGEPDLAPDGRIGLGLAERNPYDLVLLDVEMPGLDGFELCSRIHLTATNCNTPVVFITSHQDFDARARCALAGGNDLIGKPFLAFEIAVKALTLVLKTRVEAEHGSLATETVEQENDVAASAPVDVTPRTVTQAVAEPTAPSIQAADSPASNGTARFDTAFIQSGSAVPAAKADSSETQFVRALLAGAPVRLQALREQVTQLAKTTVPAQRDDLLGEVFIAIHALCADAGHARLTAVLRILAALEGMLKKLLSHPELCTAIVSETLLGAINSLDQLCRSGRDLDLKAEMPRLLVVDDDPVARRALEFALQLGFDRPDTADCGQAALAKAEKKNYDLIFLDVMMPGMDGFTTCSKLHELDPNRQTPVIFVTSKDDARARAEATASGGCGFIAKPVLPWLISPLALTHIINNRLREVPKAPIAQLSPEQAHSRLQELRSGVQGHKPAKLHQAA